MPNRYGKYIPYLLSLSDLIIINLLLWGTLQVDTFLWSLPKLREVWVFANVAYLPIIFWVFTDKYSGRAIQLDHTVANSMKAVGVHALLFIALNSIIGVTLPTFVYLHFYAMMIIALPVWWILGRMIIKILRRRGCNSMRVAIVGTNATAIRLMEEMNSDAGYGYVICGFFDNDTPPENFPGNYIGPLDMLDEFVRENNIQEIHFTLSGNRERDLSQVVKIADDNMVTFYYVPQISRYVNRTYEMHPLGSMTVLMSHPTPLKNPLNRVLKRSFDLLFSSAFLIVSPIIFIPVAIGIKMSSPGPVFFKQKRTGYKGRDFYCYKFRTMRVNANADKQQATEHDPRKTKFGDFLRHTSIDELPQFINVFLGDMSVVGPRPHMLIHTDMYRNLIGQYMVRHIVKPGVTGWAQVNGYRGLTDELWKMEKRVEHDVWYIEHWSFMLDLKIIVRTVINAAGGEKNAF